LGRTALLLVRAAVEAFDMTWNFSITRATTTAALLRARAPVAAAARHGAMMLCSALLGVLAFLECAVGDTLQQLGIVGEDADVAPVDLVGPNVEVIVAQRLEASDRRVETGLSGDVGVEGGAVVGGAAHVSLRCR